MRAAIAATATGSTACRVLAGPRASHAAGLAAGARRSGGSSSGRQQQHSTHTCRAEPDSSSSSTQEQQQPPPAAAPAAAATPPAAAPAAAAAGAPLLAPGQGTAIVTGAISILFGVAYLVLVSLMDMRGGELQPPPPEAFM
jgi:hypothetical protein